jgi:hypothetical protein
VPSAPFDVDAASAVWVMVTKRPTAAGGLLGGAGGVAELHRIAAGTAPSSTTGTGGKRTSADPSIVVRRALRWERLDVPPGSWRVYSSSNPAIELIACPSR